MLYNGSDKHVLVTQGQTGQETHVESRYCEFNIGQKESISGQVGTWFHLTTRPAFEIACLDKEGIDAQILLMSKRRLATDPLLVKVPGGYLFEKEDGESGIRAVMEKLEKEGAGSIRKSDLASLALTLENRFRGYGLEVRFGNLNWIGCVVGHGEIIIPVFLFWTDEWKEVDNPPKGVELFQVPLRDAVGMARKAVSTGRKSEKSFENDSSVELVYSLWHDFST